MSTFGYTAVDLSRLPAPDVVEPLDFEAIFSAMLAKLRELDDTFTALIESDPVYKALQVAAYRELLIRQRINDAAKAVMLAYAQKSDLDHLGALLGVGRLQLAPGDPDRGIPPTMESDTDYRRRITLAPEGFSVAGPEGAYIYHALSASSQVLDASATSPEPAHVVVTVLSRKGDGTATADLCAAVATAVNADNVRPMTDEVTVQSAVIVPYEVKGTITTFAGPDSAVVLAESRKRLDAYVAESHRIGRDITMSGLYAALHCDGIQRVTLTSPAGDIAIDRTQAPFCTAVELHYGGVDE